MRTPVLHSKTPFRDVLIFAICQVYSDDILSSSELVTHCSSLFEDRQYGCVTLVIVDEGGGCVTWRYCSCGCVV